MLQVKAFADSEAFLTTAGPWLLRAESQNNIFIGMAETLRQEPERAPSHPCFHAVFDDQSGVECVAVHLPSAGLAISQATDEAVAALVRFFSECTERPEHVRAPAVVATGFADAWQEQHGQAKNLFMKTRLHECREVVAPRECDGAMRPAAQDEVDLLATWQLEFYREAWTGDQALDSCQRSVTQAIKSQRIYVWVAGDPTTRLDETAFYRKVVDERYSWATIDNSSHLTHFRYSIPRGNRIPYSAPLLSTISRIFAICPCTCCRLQQCSQSSRFLSDTAIRDAHQLTTPVPQPS